MTKAKEAPLFSSAHAAMSWATNFRHLIVPRSSMNQMMAPSSGTGGNGLGGLDGAAQAGMILGEAKRLPGVLWGPCLFVRTAPKTIPCICGRPCCSGHTPNFEWLEAVAYLADKLRKQQEEEREPGKRGSVDNPRLRRALVIKHFEPGVSLDTIAKDCEQSLSTTSTQWSYIHQHLKQAEKGAWHALSELLYQLGIIGEDL